MKAKSVTEGRKNPSSLAELKIYGKFDVTADGEKFMLFDNEYVENRIVVFATPANLNFLLGCMDWYMDGTFSIAPPLFKQIYTIHGKLDALRINT